MFFRLSYKVWTLHITLYSLNPLNLVGRLFFDAILFIVSIFSYCVVATLVVTIIEILLFLVTFNRNKMKLNFHIEWITVPLHLYNTMYRFSKAPCSEWKPRQMVGQKNFVMNLMESICLLSTNCFSVFGNFVRLGLKRLRKDRSKLIFLNLFKTQPNFGKRCNTQFFISFHLIKRFLTNMISFLLKHQQILRIASSRVPKNLLTFLMLAVPFRACSDERTSLFN